MIGMGVFHSVVSVVGSKVFFIYLAKCIRRLKLNKGCQINISAID